ncbi:MATE family efflux transporter [Hydrogenophaga sp.]|uniref:MATE family efflux transporter n=1 Tax=Hydrogenophaga sp. TaxID=1904254 RepID=UPI0025BF81E4|nr:MATE family efflux transporter [Hydrogenophaga sp.]MBT9463480.1 MATE family efflux transporter [Hydrogenophaga sp.]
MPPSPQAAPTFVTGSTLRHVINMTATGSIGLAAVFFVDVLNLFYIAQLGQKELAAAVGYAGTLLFFLTSLAIGLSIAATALASRALGRGEREQAKLIAGASLVLMALFMGGAVLLVFPWLAELLALLGATGDTASLALRFTRWVLPSAVPLGLGMCLAALLRSLGDARRAMFVTLGAGAVSAVLDPLLILVVGWGLDGAAVATVLARCSMVVIGVQALRVHGLFAWPSAPVLRGSLKPFLAIGVPAVLTQVATPVGNAFVTAAIAPFGDNAVAGWAVIVRLIPVAFVALFALSGSVGPILGQNLGARRFDRLRSTVRDSLKVTLVYVLVVWLLMAVGSGFIADAFGAEGEARELIVFFCVFVAGSFFFNGALFVANAAFNNLGFAFYSTALNWGRATLGVAPFIWIGAQWFGARGVLAGYGLGVVVFGLMGVWLSRRVLRRLEREASSSVVVSG